MSVFGGGYEAASDVVVILSLTMLLATPVRLRRLRRC